MTFIVHYDRDMMSDRNLSIDYIKVFAIIAVVFCHISPEGYFDDHMQLLGIMRMTGVPLFLMCTGALMLNRDFSSRDSVKKFFRKNFMTLLVTSCLWYVIYMFVAQYENITLGLFVKTLFLINKPTVHLWYLRMILMYYAVLPLMVYFRKKWTAVYYLITIAVAGFVFSKTTMMLISGLEYPTVSGLSMLVYWSYMEYGRYIVGNVSTFVRCLIAFIAIISFICLCFILNNREHLFLWYDNVLVAGLSCGIFVLLRYVASVLKVEVLTIFSKQSFGIYLIHVLWLMFVWDIYLEDAEINDTIKVVIEVFFSLVASSLSVLLIGKCKPLSRLLFRN